MDAFAVSVCKGLSSSRASLTNMGKCGLWFGGFQALMPLLGFFYVDYPAARAVGGLLILAGYSLVHYTFDFRTPGFPLLAVAGWIAGIAGIWISGKPCAMRDYFRMAAEKVWFRRLCAAFWCVGALLCIWALVMTREGALQ